jgi:hypothetical protein
MRFLLFMVLLIASFSVYSQSRSPFLRQRERMCDTTIVYCKDCGSPQASYPSRLTRHFEDHIDWQNLNHIAGVVVVRVLVDSTGNPCPGGVYNRSTADNDAVANLRIGNIIMSMGKWQPAMEDGRAVNSSVLLALYAKVKGHGLFQVDYLRNDKSKKWVVETEDGPKALMYFDESAKLPQ